MFHSKNSKSKLLVVSLYSGWKLIDYVLYDALWNFWLIHFDAWIHLEFKGFWKKNCIILYFNLKIWSSIEWIFKLKNSIRHNFFWKLMNYRCIRIYWPKFRSTSLKPFEFWSHIKQKQSILWRKTSIISKTERTDHEIFSQNRNESVSQK